MTSPSVLPGDGEEGGGRSTRRVHSGHFAYKGVASPSYRLQGLTNMMRMFAIHVVVPMAGSCYYASGSVAIIIVSNVFNYA